MRILIMLFLSISMFDMEVCDFIPPSVPKECVDNKIDVDPTIKEHIIAWEICLTPLQDQGSFGCAVCLNQACQSLFPAK
jgi:hypothetical protein